ncbi:SMC family ATPase [Nocardioides sp. 503]|uniref:AAA family ATPase n=1 Tax=Nocardioides sp. 503 TaxID=2508326 RepID=UPI00106F8BF4|nr:SMC family ATPase [Nocardioides sp. 503]
MRLHHLSATAFGPFAGTVRVDFDELSEAGLFLLSGATGAGKTSVLDAVCFALYGDVPGDRNTARRLRSDQAEPGVAPEVTLEATLAGRRFRLVRSPAWERPKKRGTGTTPEQSRVALFERVGGEWRHLSGRLDETGHLVTRLVGMNVTQFTQVAMLPQGRFQTFLRARSEERHAVLQQLFRTGRFADVERWLRDRRVELRRACDVAHQDVADLVSRVSEAAATPLPADWDVRDLTDPAAEGLLGAWTDELLREATLATEQAAAEATAAAGDESASRREVEAARATHERLARHRAARQEHDALVARADDVTAARVRLDAARRAAAVAPVLRLVAQARSQRDGAAEAVARLEAHDRDQVAEAVQDAVEAVARIQALRPAATRLVEATRETASLESRVTRLGTELRAAEARERLRAVDVQVTVHELLAAVEAQLLVAHAAWNDARETALGLQEHLLTVREARLESMAGEIAGALAVGACCPVCGSADHPQKAAQQPGAPDAAAEKAALRAVDDAKSTEHLRDVEVRDLSTRRASLAAQVGETSLVDLRASRDAALAELARLGTASRAPRGVDPADHLEHRRALEREAADAGARLEQLTRECQELRTTLDEVLLGSDHDNLDALLAAQTARTQALRSVLATLDALERAEAAHAEAAQAADDAATEAGFASPAAAAEAFLEPRRAVDLESSLAAHDRRLAAVQEVLAAPGAAELDTLTAPDLQPLEAAHTEAMTRLSRSRAAQEQWTRRGGRLTALSAQLEEALARWTPLREDHQTTAALAAFVEGKSADNRLRMRLSAYVLAYRLGQVVAAANERLASMSDQRFSLVHTGDRGAGETRGGLSLLVRDDWSGETRDPATLSGGETFVVSLALALGLADVITQEVGGAALDTLFVDEGFGSLDADTLDDVMDTLDSLRDGGRVVGVVSHVAELRDRIPTQLVVTKSRLGSTVALRR